MFPLKRSVVAKDVALFCRQLGKLLEQGINLRTSLLLVGDLDRKKWGKRVNRVIASLDRGESLSNAMKRERFPPLVTSFITAGEYHSGLVRALQKCEQYYRRKHEVNQALVQALVYPAFVVILMSIAFIVMQVAVLPRFATLYDTLGIPLPWYTQLILLSTDIRLRLLFLSLGVALLLLSWLVMRDKEHPLRYRLARWVLYVPFVREAWQLRVTSVFAWQLGLLLQSGIPLTEALDIIAINWPWKKGKRAISRIEERLKRGQTLEQSFAPETGNVFHPLLPKQLAIGEEAGMVAETLLHSAEQADEQFEERTQWLLRLWEPLLILTVGFTLALMVLALFMPVMSLVEGI